MSKEVVSTAQAPAAIGPYSQAIKVQTKQVAHLVFLSGQIGLDPATGELVAGGLEAQVQQAFSNLAAVASAAGGSLAHCVKLTLFLTDLADFARVNQLMTERLPQPFAARSTVGVASLPRGAVFEVEAILALPA